MTNDLIEVVFWSIIIFLVFKYFWYSESFNEINGLKQTEYLNSIVNHVTGTLDNDDLFYNSNRLSNFANDLEREVVVKPDDWSLLNEYRIDSEDGVLDDDDDELITIHDSSSNH